MKPMMCSVTIPCLWGSLQYGPRRVTVDVKDQGSYDSIFWAGASIPVQDWASTYDSWCCLLSSLIEP